MATQDYSHVEESIVKNVQGLIKKPCDDGAALQVTLQNYMQLLQLTFDEYAPNFVLAAQILLNSVQIYGFKVDGVRINADILHDTLITKNDKNNNKKGKPQRDPENGDVDGGTGDVGANEDEEAGPAVPCVVRQARRRRRLKELVPVDEFFEVDNLTDLAGRNETDSTPEFQLNFLERNLTHFVKSIHGRQRVQVTLKKADDKDDSRLRDWVINSDLMVVRECYNSDEMSEESRYLGLDVEEEVGHEDELQADVSGGDDDGWLPSDCPPTPTPDNDNGYNSSSSEASFRTGLVKVPNPLGILLDVSMDKEKLNDDVIPTKKLKGAIMTRAPCPLCNSKKVHKQGGKVCQIENALGTLDSFFHPHVTPLVTEPQYGVLPDPEMYALYKSEMKAVEHLKRRRTREPSADAVDHVRDAPFSGFDDDNDDDLMDRGPAGDCDLDNMLSHGNDGFDLPLPEVQDSVPTDNLYGNERLHEGGAAQVFERNKELALKIAEWHDSLVEQIAVSERRGALNMDTLAGRIMSDFPSNDSNHLPKTTFAQLVRGQERRDVPRYFLACLQLTNEGNINIEKLSQSDAIQDGMGLVRLRTTRLKELDEYTNDGDTSRRSSGKRSHDDVEQETSESTIAVSRKNQVKKRGNDSPRKGASIKRKHT